MNRKHDPSELIDRYNDGSASDMERAIVESWLDRGLAGEDDDHIVFMNEDLAEIRANLQRLSSGAKIRRIRVLAGVAAGAALLLASVLMVLHFRKVDTRTLAAVRAVKAGSNRATLRLASGRVISLDDAASGQVAQENGTRISKDSSGLLSYAGDAAAMASELQLNTTTTPRGGQWHLVLADGTQVWLNAQSSVTYPNAFGQGPREVMLTGEAYFEVAKDKTRPFVVRTGKQEVEVLGTHFNVNAYADEPQVRTTLLEGSVRVTAGAEVALLSPGEESDLRGGRLDKSAADVEDAVAWKNGLFHFQKANLPAVMRDLARWYDIEVDFAQAKTTNRFVGDIDRANSLEKTLGILKTFGVRFTMEGRKLTILD